MKKLVSVIIPMYNVEKFIDRMMKCINNQIYTNLEIIIINDGSTDKSLEIIKQYATKDNRIKIISTENKGVSNARNLGIENSNGDYITFLDMDDYIEYDMYEKIINKIEETNAEVLRCNYVKEDEFGNVLLEGNLMELSNTVLYNKEIENKMLPNIFLDKLPTYMPLLTIKKDIIKDKLKFDTNIFMMEDLLFCLNLYRKINNIYLFDYKCYHYVVNKNSIMKSRKNIMKNYYGTLKIIHILEKFFSENKFDNMMYSNMYLTYSIMLIKYILRTFQQDDEYRMNYNKLVEVLNTDDAISFIKKADFSMYNNEYIKKAAKYIQDNKFEDLYKFAIEIKKIEI